MPPEHHPRTQSRFFSRRLRASLPQLSRRHAGPLAQKRNRRRRHPWPRRRPRPLRQPHHHRRRCRAGPLRRNYGPLQENLALLKSMKDTDGRNFRIETLPMPAPVYFDRQRLPASYANFYIANKLVMVPTFNDANDRVALNTLAGLFPDREVVGIACRDLVLGLGTLHCMTQQQPQ